MSNIPNHKIGLVTVTYNSALVISAFIESLIKQSYKNWELFIIDNNSQDSTLDYLKSYLHTETNSIHPDIFLSEIDSRIIILPQADNYGFAKASNIGIKAAIANNCSYISLINNDTVLTPDLLTMLHDELIDKKADVIAPKILYTEPTNTLWYAGGYFNAKEAQKNIHRGMNEVDVGQYDQSTWVDFASMCCVLIRSEIIIKMGYLDEKYFVYYEDADWMHRAKLAGIRVWYMAQAKIYHKAGNLTGGPKSPFTVYHATRGKVYFIKKFYHGIARYYWLGGYFAGFFIGLIMGRYTIDEFKIKLRAFFNLPYRA